MAFALPSDDELKLMGFFDSDEDEIQLNGWPIRQIEEPIEQKTKPKLRKRRLSDEYWNSPKKQMLEPIPGIQSGYLTPPRATVAVPSSPSKPGPSTPVDAKKTGGWLPITPNKEHMYE
jgi:hypothetical protein